MLFLPLSILLFLLFILLLPLLFFLLQMKLVGHALVKIGISSAVATLIFFLSIIGSLINIPLLSGNQNIAINVGGAIIPLLLCIYLFPKVPILKTIIAVMISALIMNKMAQPIPMVGVTIPMFIPPLVAVLLGKGTISAIQSGIIYGSAEAIAGLIRKIKKDYRKKLLVIGTGGWIETLAPLIKSIDNIQPYLTLKGLALIGATRKK